MNFMRFCLIFFSFVGFVLGNGNGKITLDDVIPGNPQIVEWSPDEKPDFTYARKVFELVVIRRLTLFHSRGDLPSLSLWAKKMKDSSLVRSADVIQEIYAHLMSNRIDTRLLPLGWDTVLTKSAELKKKMMELDDIKSTSRKAVLSAAWEAFDYWITIQDSDLPSSPEEWWDHGPAQLVKQLESKISFVSNLKLEGLMEAAKSYSALRLAYGRSKAAQHHKQDELKSLSEESAINLLLRLVIKSCPDILDSILTSVNRMITLKDDGKYYKEYGLPYLYDEIGHVRSLLSPPKFGLPYNLESKAGIERFNLHLRIRNANLDKENDIEATDVELLPEQIKLHYILQNSIEAFKFISWSEHDIEYGYMYGLKSNTLFEPVSTLWNAFIYNKAGEIHPEILSLNKCLLSHEFSAQVSDIISKFEVSIEGVPIPPIYNIYSGDYSRLERFILPTSQYITQLRPQTEKTPAEHIPEQENQDTDALKRKLLSTSALNIIDPERTSSPCSISISPKYTSDVTTTTTTTAVPKLPKTTLEEPPEQEESPLLSTPESESGLDSPSSVPIEPSILGMSASPVTQGLGHHAPRPLPEGSPLSMQEDSALAVIQSPQGNNDSE